jgi:hypothetical protein
MDSAALRLAGLRLSCGHPTGCMSQLAASCPLVLVLPD